ncbi:hypothetical protein [Lactovum odontotermitis]
MAIKEEWLEYFEVVNGRKPTLDEFAAARKNGEFSGLSTAYSSSNDYVSVTHNPVLYLVFSISVSLILEIVLFIRLGSELGAICFMTILFISFLVIPIIMLIIKQSKKS